jgi:hypothetical protein
MTPEQLFNSMAVGFLGRWGIVTSLRRVAEAGLPLAARVLASQDAAFVRSLDTDPALRGFITPGPLPQEIGAQIASAMTANTLAAARSSVDAAALVFAHAIIDDTALGYCRVAAMADPADWEPKLLDKKVSLGDVKAKGVPELLRELIDARLEQLERESLCEKVECLLRSCRPPAGFAPLDDYEFSIERLRAVDQLRHDVVHSGFLGKVIPNADAELDFLWKTGGGFLAALVAHRYGVRFDLAQQAAEMGLRPGAPP